MHRSARRPEFLTTDAVRLVLGTIQLIQADAPSAIAPENPASPSKPGADGRHGSGFHREGERPALLDNAHRELDAAVATAYGWPEHISEEEALARLLALNHERAAAGR